MHALLSIGLSSADGGSASPLFGGDRARMMLESNTAGGARFAMAVVDDQ